MADVELVTDSTLNGGTVTVTVFEDVGATGSGPSTDPNGKAYDTSNSTTLSGGASESNTLSGFDEASGNEYWAHINPVASSITATSPTVTSAEVVVDTSQPVTAPVPAESLTVQEPEPAVSTSPVVSIGAETLSVDDPVPAMAIPGVTVIDDFEDGDFSEYSDQPGDWTTVSSPTQSGNDAASVDEFTQILSAPGDGLPYYPQKGDRIRFYTYHEGGDPTVRFYFGGDGSQDNTYAVIFDSGFHEIEKWTGGTTDLIDRQTSYAIEADQWYQHDVIWDDGTHGGQDNDITWEVRDPDGNLVVDLSGNDSDHASQRGIGFYASDFEAGETLYVDYAHVVPSETRTQMPSESVTVQEPTVGTRLGAISFTLPAETLTLQEPTGFIGIPTHVIDDFEDEDMSEYDDSDLDTPGGETFPSESFSGDVSVAYDAANGGIVIGDGLSDGYAKGDGDLIFYYRQTEGSNGDPWFPFAVQDVENYYAIRWNISNSRLVVVRITPTSGSLIGNADDTVNLEADQWYEVRIRWDDGTLGGSDGDITAWVSRIDTGEVLGSCDANDTTSGLQDNTYIGLSPGGGTAGETQYYDRVVRTTEPRVQPVSIPAGVDTITTQEPTAAPADAPATIPTDVATIGTQQPTAATSAPGTVAPSVDVVTIAEPMPTTAAPGTAAMDAEVTTAQEPGLNLSQQGTVTLGVGTIASQEPAPGTNAHTAAPMPVDTLTTVEPDPALTVATTIPVGAEAITTDEPDITTTLILTVRTSVPPETLALDQPSLTASQPGTATMGVDTLTTSEPTPTVRAPPVVALTADTAATVEPNPVLSAPGTITIQRAANVLMEPGIDTGALTHVSMPAEMVTANDPVPDIIWPLYASMPVETATAVEPSPTTSAPGTASVPASTVTATQPAVTLDAPITTLTPSESLTTTEPAPTASQPGAVLLTADTLATSEPVVGTSLSQPVVVPVSAESIGTDEPGVVLVAPRLVESLREADAELVLERRVGHVHDTVLVLRREGDSIIVEEREADSTLTLE